MQAKPPAVGRKNKIVQAALTVAIVTLTLSSTGVGAQEESAKEKEKLRRELGLDTKTEVTVEQDKVYQRTGRFEIAVFGGIVPNDGLVTFFTEGVHLSYFLSEIWGVELSYGEAQTLESQLLKDLESGRKTTNGTVVNVGVSRTKRFFSGGFVFHPIYGKFSLFAHRTIHYDTFLVAGVGSSLTTEKRLDSTDTGSFELSNHYRFNTYFGIGQRYYINSYFAIRVDVRDYVVLDRVLDNRDIQNDLVVSLGVSVLFPFKGK